MHAVRVQRNKKSKAQDEVLTAEISKLAEPFLKGPAEDEINHSVGFSAGNPRVEHITGVVHLFRHIPPGAEDAPVALPEDRGELLCVLSRPGEIGVAEFCAFAGGYLPQLREMRFVRKQGGQALCLVLLRFSGTAQADAFYADFNGRPFSSLEPDVLCRLVYVRDVEVSSGEDLVAISAGQTELPTCPVCLERLDQHISGVVTTVCNHKFHNECLQRWGDTSCPVCRYCANANATSSHCSTCGTTQDLWICLICGHIGCGRYREGHAIDHWQGSDHAYALDLETQRVWDYISDGYVHRLVQSKTDGKLVEVPSPAPTQSAAPRPRGPSREPDSCSSSQAGGARRGDGDEEMDEAMLASKMDHIAMEYNHLLVSQLDSQRVYFEALLRKRDAEAAASTLEAGQAAERNGAAAHAAAAQAQEANRARRAAERKLADVAGKATKLEKEADFLRHLNDTLLCNQRKFQEQAQALQATAAKDKEAAAAQIEDLEQQVRDLMFFVEAREKIAEQAGRTLQEGTVLPVPEPPPAPKRRVLGKKR